MLDPLYLQQEENSCKILYVLCFSASVYGNGYMSSLFPNGNVLLDVSRGYSSVSVAGQGVSIKVAFKEIYCNWMG